MSCEFYKLFVYGTLKRKQPNARLLSNGFSRYLGSGITKDKFPLVIATEYNTPYLLDAEGQGKNVHGEILLIDSKMLSIFDELESFYILPRKEIDIMVLSDQSGQDISDTGSSEKCWVYTMPDYKPEFLDLPFLDNYDAYGSHGLTYVLPEKLDPNIDWMPLVKDKND